MAINISILLFPVITAYVISWFWIFGIIFIIILFNLALENYLWTKWSDQYFYFLKHIYIYIFPIVHLDTLFFLFLFPQKGFSIVVKYSVAHVPLVGWWNSPYYAKSRSIFIWLVSQVLTSVCQNSFFFTT